MTEEYDFDVVEVGDEIRLEIGSVVCEGVVMRHRSNESGDRVVEVSTGDGEIQEIVYSPHPSQNRRDYTLELLGWSDE